MKNIITTFALILAPLAVFGACDVDPDEEKEGDPKADCAEVCDRLAECAIEGDDFDEAACNDGCQGEAADSENFESDVKECRTCIDKEFGFGDDDTCATDFSVCGNECAAVTFQSN